MNWALTRPLAPSASTIRSIVATMSAWSPSLTVCGGNTPTESPAVHAGTLDVLEQARDEHPLAVGDGVDVDLDALEVAVDADRAIGVDHGRGGQLALEVVGGVAEVDGQAADDEARPDDDRVADALGERQRLVDAVGHPAFGLGDAETVQQGREPGPLLGLVDGLEVAAEERHAARGQGRRQVERRLAAERHDRRQEPLPVGRFGVDDRAHALGVERLEVEARRRIEVGRDGLRVRVDHDRAPAELAERVRRVDGAVVELDPLPDPDRPRADDQRRRAGHRRRLGRRARGRVRRVEVRRLGRELRGARVDHREPGPQPERQPGRPELRRGGAGQAGQLAIPEARALDRGEQRRGLGVRGVGQPRPGLLDLGLERDVAAHLGEEPGGDARRLADDRLGHAPAEQAEQPPEPAVGRRR